IALPMGGIYLAMPGRQVQALFKTSRNLVPTPSLFTALTTFFGLSRKDFRIFEHDHITQFEAGKGFTTKHSDTSRRIMEHQRNDFKEFLQGYKLKAITLRFSVNLRHEMRIDRGIPYSGDNQKGWIDLPDLYQLVVSWTFRAQVDAIYGEYLLKLCPSIFEDFCAFYNAFPIISRKLPRWLYPSQYRARDKMQENFQSWRNWCKFNGKDTEIWNADYEPVWGTQYVRKMVERHEDLGFSDEGIASVMLGYLFVTVANTLPAIAWMVLHIVLDQNLAARIESELRIGSSTLESPNDISHLLKLPLLNSVYRETLRLHIAGAVGRTSWNTKFCLVDRGTVDRGVPIFFTNWLGGLDETFWNTGNILPSGRPEHPVDTFWAERFLKYPDDPDGGPIRQQESPLRTISDNVPRKSSVDDRRATLVTAGLSGHWFPFGGGIYRCPGEALAGQTILSAVAMVLQAMEIKLLDPEEASKTRSRQKTLPFGSHAFDRKVPVRVRRR
ncbi:cytochrome P450, partial [Xylariales sp. PMI_506]